MCSWSGSLEGQLVPCSHFQMARGTGNPDSLVPQLNALPTEGCQHGTLPGWPCHQLPAHCSFRCYFRS